ncbi:peptide/nickel transport system ATP-binding protein [Branchiibius hedensis]|uniref:Peptide/nickel transport system ATP-binding protein n=1 Tax=Branchiibius hedensis TaxID=672460 RepID=A0A2Y8ZRQ0_9MICO|nr:ABC transporter ATP-binding protein [Branchiibius hedensis]PWJ26248.1 peptide/nickel transport system ATP-binding protein [Branchiibius hedensis]SSA35060.1 peptide/nickel transport system ATP-binding protein [Branchiibius hedensis]
MTALRARDVSVRHGETTLVEPIDLDIEAGRCLAVIGESGSGKTMTARAIAGLLPRGVTASGSMQLGDRTIDLPGNERVWANIRGEQIALLLQDPFTSLSPVHRCGQQLAQALQAEDRRRGRRRSRADLQEQVLLRLEEVRLPGRVARQYPHELSGGMRQRVAIAATLAADPDILIADEPTTALDATVQAGILDLLTTLCQERDLGLLLISHDLGIVQGRAQSVIVMRDGRVVERGATADVLSSPQEDYTRRLLASSPSLSDVRQRDTRTTADPLLEALDVSKSFDNRPVLFDVSVRLYAGEMLALVGESGSGKSTMARVIAGLETPESGTMTYAGRPLGWGRADRSPDQVQVVFQDPNSTLNPAFTVAKTLTEALRVAGRPGSDLAGLLESVDLDPGLADRKPGQLSGGQRQRVAIARALAPKPSVLLCDESVSALDVSVQAQILQMLTEVTQKLDLAVLFITHDLAVVAEIADRVAVMRDGRIVETGSAASVITAPQHEYTAELVASARAQSLTKG